MSGGVMCVVNARGDVIGEYSVLPDEMWQAKMNSIVQHVNDVRTRDGNGNKNVPLPFPDVPFERIPLKGGE